MLDSCFDRHAEFAELEQVVMWGEPVDALKQKQSEALIKLFELCAEEARKLLADLKRAEEERRAAEAARLLNEREEEERMIREMRTEAMAEAAAVELLASIEEDEQHGSDMISLPFFDEPSSKEAQRKLAVSARDDAKAAKKAAKLARKRNGHHAHAPEANATAANWRDAEVARELVEEGGVAAMPGGERRGQRQQSEDISEIRELLNTGPPPSHRQAQA